VPKTLCARVWWTRCTSGEIRPDGLAEVKALRQARDRDARLPGHHQEPEHLGRLRLHHAGATNHYPIARDCLKAGKHVLLESRCAIELWEATS